MNGFASRGQLKESGKVPGGFKTHDEALQLFALLLADDIVTERGEFYGDFFRSCDRADRPWGHRHASSEIHRVTVA